MQVEDFGQLFKDSLHRLIGFLITAGARRVDAEDAVQMAFIELAKVWDSAEHPLAWVRKFAFRMWTKIFGRSRIDELVSSFPDHIGRDDDDEIVGQSKVIHILRRLGQWGCPP
ncbi:sigma-70 family RNA polymerase sigma factor [Streptomyces sp. DH-12]|uniref:RNA polymerase sigma factor n=1 Tax=Streptomyces sp. DH-12 TaxID=2072509 RepID=UPI001057441A|nr:sigma-70 family RNA polymerase sigma factor [Streptomyces sp. DH-12]